MKKHDAAPTHGENFSDFSDELRLFGTRTLSVRGCGGILFYSEGEIRLSMRSYVLKITGSRLFCASYLYRTVRVEGEISSLTLERRGKNEKI